MASCHKQTTRTNLVRNAQLEKPIEGQGERLVLTDNKRDNGNMLALLQ